MSTPVGIILAAGFGTRFRPQTELLPKPLIPCAGVEPLFYQLCRFEEAGITKVVINAHHLANKIIGRVEYFKKLLPGMQLEISHEKEILGSAGGLYKIFQDNKDWFKDSGALMINGDVVSNLNLSPLISDLDSNIFSYSKREDFLGHYRPVFINEEKKYSGYEEPNEFEGVHFLGHHYLSSKSIKLLEGLSLDFHGLFESLYPKIAEGGESILGVDYPLEGGSDFWYSLEGETYLLKAQKRLLGSLDKEEFWKKILQKRFPKITKNSYGLWSNVQEVDFVKVESPTALFLKEGGKIKGHDVCLKKYSVYFDAGSCDVELGDVEIENALVYNDSEKVKNLTVKEGVKIL